MYFLFVCLFLLGILFKGRSLQKLKWILFEVFLDCLNVFTEN